MECESLLEADNDKKSELLHLPIEPLDGKSHDIEKEPRMDSTPTNPDPFLNAISAALSCGTVFVDVIINLYSSESSER